MHLWRGEFAAAVDPVEPDDTQLRELLWRGIADLPSLQRAVVLHRIIAGLTIADTARALNRAEGTIKASLHAALKTLRVQLGDVRA